MGQDIDKRQKELVLKITGMHCASCVRRVEQALESTPGVISAAVNLATEKAAIAYDPTLVTPTALAEEVKNLGYNVVIDKLELAITGMHCASCVRRVEQALESTPGVISAAVNLATGRTTVTYSPSDTSARTNNSSNKGYRI